MSSESGLVPIEALHSGDHVLSPNDAQCLERAPILTGRHGWAWELVDITVSGETISCSPEHPFWVVGRGWVRAGTLTTEAQLLSADGESIEILGITHRTLCEPVPVFNITVGGTHVYFIGKTRILVHNKVI